jgi:hypothetical protein
MQDAPLKSRVVKIEQSPLNKRWWFLELACGHTILVYERRRPRQKLGSCPYKHAMREKEVA